VVLWTAVSNEDRRVCSSVKTTFCNEKRRVGMAAFFMSEYQSFLFPCTLSFVINMGARIGKRDDDEDSDMSSLPTLPCYP